MLKSYEVRPAVDEISLDTPLTKVKKKEKGRRGEKGEKGEEERGKEELRERGTKRKNKKI